MSDTFTITINGEKCELFIEHPPVEWLNRQIDKYRVNMMVTYTDGIRDNTLTRYFDTLEETRDYIHYLINEILSFLSPCAAPYFNEIRECSGQISLHEDVDDILQRLGI